MEVDDLCKTKELIIDCTNGFLDGFFESPADTHDLTNAFHAAAQEWADATKLFEVPTRDFDDNVIQTWLEACACYFGDRILDLVQRYT